MHWWERMFRRTRAERQLDAELRDHLERHIADLKAQGIDDTEARRRARLMFGGVDRIKEECRDASGTRGIETTMQDVRYAWRGLVALPAFTIVIVLSLALGIGANTAAFTLLHATLLRALPIAQPGQLVELTSYDANADSADHFSYPLYTSFRDALRAQADVAAVFPQRVARVSVDDAGGGADAVEHAVVEGASANYFTMLGVAPGEGRLFVDGDDRPAGGQMIAVISHAYRERRFGGANASASASPSHTPTSVEGRTLIIEDRSFIIVGVAPKGFDGVEAQAKTDIWIPVTTAMPPKWLESYGSKVLRLIARMRPESDVAQTAAMADVIYRRHIVDRVLPGMVGSARAVLEKRHLRFRPARIWPRDDRPGVSAAAHHPDGIGRDRAAALLRERRESAAGASARA